ncbi:hypothetical protein BH09ACT12_BH09ACT12_12100 [soil metagenome]
MVPASVGRVSRDWDEQHVDLRAAAQQLAHAPTAGFTAPVARAAADFVRAWAQHTGAAAELSEHQADALRVVMAAWIRTDEQAGARAFELLPYLDERR